MIGAIAPLKAARTQSARELGAVSARDAEAARVIAASADEGNEAAAAFSKEAQTLLGMADVSRCRADRLRAASTKAAVMGYDRLSSLGSDAAMLEDQNADYLEASVVGAVREAHEPSLLGYVSAEEQRLLKRKSLQESMTTGQLESSFRTMLNTLYDEAQNFGLEADEDEERGDGDVAKRLGDAFEVFGGDVPVLFGEDAYGAFFDFAKPSAERIAKRLARKRRALEKAESKLEQLEDAGKKGLKVRYLRMRVNALEKSIARLESKQEKLDGAVDQVRSSRKKAKAMRVAEEAKVQEAADPDADLNLDDEDIDFGLISAADAFGLAPWRRRRISRRIAQLRARMASVRSPQKRRKLAKRIARLRSRISSGRRRPMFRRRRFRHSRARSLSRSPQVMPYSYPSYDEMPSVLFGDEDDYGDDYDTLGGTDDSQDEFGGECAGRRVFVGFFERRADAMGGGQISTEDEAFGGFWDNIKAWWRNLGQKTSAVAKKAGRAVKAETSARRAARQAARPHRRAGRQAWRKAYRAAKGGRGSVGGPRVVKGAGGYTYQQEPSGTITILDGPTGKGKQLSSGAAWTAITNEIGPHPSAAVVGGVFETLVAPGTNRDKIQFIARELDQAIVKYGPESSVVSSLKNRLDDAHEEASLFGPDAISTLDEDEDLDLDELEAGVL